MGGGKLKGCLGLGEQGSEILAGRCVELLPGDWGMVWGGSGLKERGCGVAVGQEGLWFGVRVVQEGMGFGSWCDLG